MAEKLVKILIVGDSGVGKTSLLMRYAENTYTEAYRQTIGVDFKSKVVTVCDQKYKLQIWDTAGQERFRTITSSWYRLADVCIFAYDISDEESFNNATDQWLKQYESYRTKDASLFLVGLKCDLKNKRIISSERGQSTASTHNMFFFETSAKTCENVNLLFEIIAHYVIHHSIKPHEEYKQFIRILAYSFLAADGTSVEKTSLIRIPAGQSRYPEIETVTDEKDLYHACPGGTLYAPISPEIQLKFYFHSPVLMIGGGTTSEGYKKRGYYTAGRNYNDSTEIKYDIDGNWKSFFFWKQISDLKPSFLTFDLGSDSHLKDEFNGIGDPNDDTYPMTGYDRFKDYLTTSKKPPKYVVIEGYFFERELHFRLGDNSPIEDVMAGLKYDLQWKFVRFDDGNNRVHIFFILHYTGKEFKMDEKMRNALTFDAMHTKSLNGNGEFHGYYKWKPEIKIMDYNSFEDMIDDFALLLRFPKLFD